MSLVRTVQLCATLALCTVGCQAIPKVPSSAAQSSTHVSPVPTAPSVVEQAAVSEASFQQPLLLAAEHSEKSASDSQAELSLPQLVEEVQARNPTLAAMTAAWRAATQRYPQVVALDDPMFMAMAAPGSFDSDDVEAAYAFQTSQKFPWFGKRAARGRQARAEANAAYHDLEDSRLQLTEVTQMAFFDYYLARRKLDLNRQNLEVIRQFRGTAQTKYQANQVTQQDVLQADVELAEIERKNIEFERMDKVATARINTLLREDPYAALPPPPPQLDAPAAKLDIETLQQNAVNRRPDLAALAARVRAEQAAAALACKDYYPDLDVFGRYDSFWQPAETQSDLRGQVGVNINVPIYRGRLNAAVQEALFRVSQRRAEYEQRRLDILYEVANSHALVEESRRTLVLYSERLIPASQQNVAAARSNYDVNKLSFLDLAIAQRQLIDLREKQQEALAAYHSRLAELMRVVGDSSAIAESTEEVPVPAPQ